MVLDANLGGALAPALVDRLLNTDEACRFLNCHERTLRRHIRAGRVRALRLGKRMKFRLADLERALTPEDAKAEALAMEDFAKS